MFSTSCSPYAPLTYPLLAAIVVVLLGMDVYGTGMLFIRAICCFASVSNPPLLDPNGAGKRCADEVGAVFEVQGLVNCGPGAAYDKWWKLTAPS